MTSKVILTNVQVLAAGTQDRARHREDNKPMSVSVVTLLVDPLRGRAADAGQHRRQDSARAAQSARQDDAADAWDQAGGPARPVGDGAARRGRRRRAAVAVAAPRRPRRSRRRRRCRPSKSSAAISARTKSCARSMQMTAGTSHVWHSDRRRGPARRHLTRKSPACRTPTRQPRSANAVIDTPATPVQHRWSAVRRSRHRHADRARVADQRRRRRRDGHVAEPAAAARQDAGHDLDVRVGSRRRRSAATRSPSQRDLGAARRTGQGAVPGRDHPGRRATAATSCCPGTCRSKDVAEKAVNLARRLRREEGRRRHAAAGAAGAPSNQVLLRVRFAEVSRSALTELGAVALHRPDRHQQHARPRRPRSSSRRPASRARMRRRRATRVRRAGHERERQVHVQRLPEPLRLQRASTTSAC